MKLYVPDRKKDITFKYQRIIVEFKMPATRRGITVNYRSHRHQAQFAEKKPVNIIMLSFPCLSSIPFIIFHMFACLWKLHSTEDYLLTVFPCLFLSSFFSLWPCSLLCSSGCSVCRTSSFQFKTVRLPNVTGPNIHLPNGVITLPFAPYTLLVY